MSKPIKLTDDLLRKITEEFIASVKNAKMFDGKLNYSKNFRWDDDGDDRASITFSSVAFAKMVMLLQSFDSEVAWHGVAFRDESRKNSFLITDILVYPQEVSGSTVNTDQAAYTEWLYSFDDDVFNNIRMQGHSHVNFSTSPSGVDETHQEKILEQLDDDMFYIFMIWNKKFEKTIKIYDLKHNTLYETADIDVYIGENGVNLHEFIEDSKKMVVKKTYQPAGYQYQAKTTNPVTTVTTPATPKSAASTTKGKQKSKEKGNIGGNGKGYNYGYGYGYEYDDEDDPYGYLGGFAK